MKALFNKKNVLLALLCFFVFVFLFVPSRPASAVTLLGTENTRPKAGDEQMWVNIYEIVIGNEICVADLVVNLPEKITKETYNFDGCGLEPENCLLYFSRFDKKSETDLQPSPLYFNDLFNVQKQATTDKPLTGAVAGGTFYIGRYYYVAQGTDDLYEVSFSKSGTIADETKVCDLVEDKYSLALGDIAFNPLEDGVLYGTATKITNKRPPPKIFFKVKVSGDNCKDFNVLVEDVNFGAGHLEIAFGEDNQLYGHNPADGRFYRINITDGSYSFICTTRTYDGGLLRLSDLSRGSGTCAPVMVPVVKDIDQIKGIIDTEVKEDTEGTEGTKDTEEVKTGEEAQTELQTEQKPQPEK